MNKAEGLGWKAWLAGRDNSDPTVGGSGGSSAVKGEDEACFMPLTATVRVNS